MLFKDIWDSGFGSVLWFCERFLEVPQAAKNRCSKLSATEALPVKTPWPINACAFLYMFLMNSRSLW